jgi:hypothetical protein
VTFRSAKLALCPTPYKEAFSRADVNAAANRWKRLRHSRWMKGKITPYRCRCGSWHLAVQPRSQANRRRR